MKSKRWLPLGAGITLLLVSLPFGTAAFSDKQEAEAAVQAIRVTQAVSDLTAWTVTGKGTLEDTDQGLRLASDPSDNAIAVSSTEAEDFVYEADVMIADAKADASLVFRSSADGWSSYMLQIVPQAGLLRLKDAGTGGMLLEEHPIAVQAGGIYHLKVKADGTRLKVYWDDRYNPLIDVSDDAHRSGYFGLHVWDGSAVFQNIRVSGLSGNLGEPAYRTGSWQPDLKGLKGTGAAVQIYNKRYDDLILEGDIALGSAPSEGAIRFRTDAAGTSGYAVSLRKEGNQVRAQLRGADGTVLAESGRTYSTEVFARHHVEISAIGSRIQVYIDGYAAPAIEVTDNRYKSGYAGLSVSAGSAYFQNAYATAAADHYTEKYRPAYHYSPARGSASDPNGLVYFEGEYHLFHQDGGTWAHAVSTDLLNWKRLPIALPWNDLGHVWSGSAVADLTNASGLFADSGGKGLIAYYTSFNPDRQNGNQRIGMAYSKDSGRTWTYSQEHPIVIENPGKQGNDPGGWDFRDPKVVRDEANGRWVMVVSGGDHIRFFTSVNLIDWTLTDNFGYGAYVRGGVWECPDLFQLPVDGTGARKWVLMISTGANPNTQGSDAEYFVGQLTPEGKFVNDNPVGTVLRTDYGKEFYASSSFADTPDGRRIVMAWMTNWDYPFSFPTQGWKGVLSLPRELSLASTNEGVRLKQTPIAELNALRTEIYAAANKDVKPDGNNLLKGLTAGAYEIEAVIEIPKGSGAREFGFQLRKGAEEVTKVGYRPVDKAMFVDRSASGVTDFSPQFSTLHTAPLSIVGNRVTLRTFVDESSVELFGGGGQSTITDVIFPDPASRGMAFYTEGGGVKVVSLKVYAMKSLWTKQDSVRIMMDARPREIHIGDAETLHAAVEKGEGKGVEPIKWTTSDSAVATVEYADNAKAVIRAAGKGTAVITASSKNGKAKKSVPVQVFGGVFETNLTGWKADLSAAAWVATEQGIRGSYTDGDANYVAQETAGDFVYEADMRLAESGGAGSLLFRSSEDGRSGYYFNLDRTMKAFRLFYKVDGEFADRQVLAKVPAFVEPERTYHVRIEASGPHIRIAVDGKPIVDVSDGTFAEGRFGVNVFGGQAYYQNVKASGLQPARLQRASFVNTGVGGYLYAAKSQNGEPVTVTDVVPGQAAQVWIFVPTGDERGSYSIRTPEGKALDLDTGMNRVQLYSYLGFDNQRWLLQKQEDGSAVILSAHNGKALAVSESGTGLVLTDLDRTNDKQRWSMQD